MLLCCFDKSTALSSARESCVTESTDGVSAGFEFIRGQCEDTMWISGMAHQSWKVFLVNVLRDAGMSSTVGIPVLRELVLEVGQKVARAVGHSSTEDH